MSLLRIASVSVASVGIVAIGAGFASGGVGYLGYNGIVPKFNGSAYTPTQTKAIDRRSGDLNSRSVGGNYRLDVRMEAPGNPISSVWFRIGDNQSIQLPNLFVRGTRVYVHFSNDLFTPVNVQATGSWRSN